MIPLQRPYRKVEFVDGDCEISFIADDWDKTVYFDETMFLHFLNLGWRVEE